MMWRDDDNQAESIECRHKCQLLSIYRPVTQSELIGSHREFYVCFNVLLHVFMILITKWTVNFPLLLVYVDSFI